MSYPAGQGGVFEKNVRRLLDGEEALARIVVPILEAWRATRVHAAELGRQLTAAGRHSQPCQLLMLIPGVGVVTATAFTTAIEEPANFAKSRSAARGLG